MNIYILLSAPVLGEVSATTEKERIILCENCNIKELTFKNASLLLDKWNGEDLISALGQFFISERLKAKFDSLEIAYQATSFDVILKKPSEKYKNQSLKFYRIIFKNVCKGFLNPWFELISKCEVCEREKWMMDTDGYASSANPNLVGEDIKNPAPRNVYKNSWKGENAFLLQDEYNFPIVTQSFVDILVELGVKINKKGGVWLRPTNWIDENKNIIE